MTIRASKGDGNSLSAPSNQQCDDSNRPELYSSGTTKQLDDAIIATTGNVGLSGIVVGD